jgi:hypothetical protein
LNLFKASKKRRNLPETPSPHLANPEVFMVDFSTVYGKMGLWAFPAERENIRARLHFKKIKNKPCLPIYNFW